MTDSNQSTSLRHRIWQKWEQEAREYRNSREASWKDILIFKEINTVEHFLVKEGKILDLGCANGFSTLKWLKTTRAHIVGLDYSPEMIRMANENKNELSEEAKKRVDFFVGDILKLPSYYDADSMDQAITKRVITNLENEDVQIEAVKNIHHVLKKGGVYICSEPSIQGLNAVNKMRRFFGLEPIVAPWHNCYLNEASFIKRIEKYFQLIRVVNFSSAYYFGSRVIYAFLAQLFRRPTEHNSILNRLSLWLPNFGNLGVQKLFLFKKG